MTTYAVWRRRLVGAAILSAVPGLAFAETEFERLIAASQAEMAAQGGQLSVALDWTNSDAGPVMAAFAEEFDWIHQVDYQRETGTGPFARFLIEIQQGIYPPYDILHVASEFQQQYWDLGAFVQPPFDYFAINESLPDDWPRISDLAMDPEGRYIATSANIRGNAWNPDLVPEGEEPLTWADCIDPRWQGDVVTDARNKGQAFQHDAESREWFIPWLEALRENEVVIERGQARVLQAVAAGEYAIACLVNFTTTQRLIDVDGVTTLRFTLADTIPLEFGSRLWVLAGSETPATLQLFATWVATRGQPILDQAAYRGFPWVPGTRLYEQAQGRYIALCGADCADNFEEYNREFIEILGFPAAWAED